MAAPVGQGARHGLVFGFAGYSGSGKTSLIEQVIPRLVAAGRTVSVIKHAHHRFDFDTPGKDSWRHRQAGATEVLLTTDQRWVLMHELRGQPEPGLEAQLARMSGQTVLFHTAVAVVQASRGFAQSSLATVTVRFRTLDAATIERYLLAEQPYDCAGSAKSEGLGIALLQAIESDDPTALIGLPLIRTAQLLRAAGLTLP